jgi:hypothetical protein
MHRPFIVCTIYAPEDEVFHRILVQHLMPMRRSGLLFTTSYTDTDLGTNIEIASIDKIRSSDIMLLLVSADYFKDNNFERLEPLLKELLLRIEYIITRIIPIRPFSIELDPILSNIPLLSEEINYVNIEGSKTETDELFVRMVRALNTLVKKLQKRNAQKIENIDGVRRFMLTNFFKNITRTKL